MRGQERQYEAAECVCVCEWRVCVCGWWSVRDESSSYLEAWFNDTVGFQGGDHDVHDPEDDKDT